MPCFDALLPQRPELVGILAVPGFQLRVNAGEHLSPQGLGVVVGQDQPHVRRGPAVAAGIFAGAGDDHIPPAPQQRLKCHDKGQVVPALHLPVGEQGLVVDEPPAVPDPGGAALLAEVLRHGDLFHGGKGLVVPEPEGQHPQKAAADLEQPVDESQVVPGGKGQGFPLRLQIRYGRNHSFRDLVSGTAAAKQGHCQKHREQQGSHSFSFHFLTPHPVFPAYFHISEFCGCLTVIFPRSIAFFSRVFNQFSEKS